MHITAPGVQAQALDGDRYRFRYDGLRLLDASGGKYFLVYDGWPGRQVSASRCGTTTPSAWN